MRTFNYTPSSPFSGKLTNLGISLVMIVFPLVAPFGIRIGSMRDPGPSAPVRIGSMRILGPTAVTILFVAGGAVLLLCTLLEIRKARALAAAGGRITIDGDRVTFPVVRKGAVTEETLLIPQVERTKFDEEENEFEIALPDAHHTFNAGYFDSEEEFEAFRALFEKA